MDNLIDFFTSSKAIYLYTVVLLLVIVGITYYYVKKSSNKRRQKQNTKELNDFVSQVEEYSNKLDNNKEINITKENEIQKEEVESVIINTTDNLKNVDVIEELARDIKIEPIEKIEPMDVNSNKVISEIKKEDKIEEIVPTNDANISIVTEPIEEKIALGDISNKQEELEYAPIELNKEEAIKELEKITEELTLQEQKKEQEEISISEQSIKQENINEEKESNNILLTEFEKEQEENAIISLDELMAKADVIYDKNEEIQYQDEGNEPISIEDLERKWEEERKNIESINNEVVVEEIKAEPIMENVESIMPEDLTKPVVPITDLYKEYKSSPIISPVYGIEREKYERIEKEHPTIVNNSELALENTANYEKFDEEIRKTNKFIESLKELQKKLD